MKKNAKNQEKIVTLSFDYAALQLRCATSLLIQYFISYPHVLTGNVKAQAEDGSEQIGGLANAGITHQHFFASLQ